MTAVYQTAYPRINPNLSQEAINEAYKITAAEKRFIANHCRQKSVSQLGMLVQLKMAQRLGRFTAYAKIPSEIVKHIKRQVRSDVKLTQLKDYFTRRTRDQHVKLIRKYLKLNPFDASASDNVRAWAEEAALTKESVADIINVVIERLVQARIELPAFEALEKPCEKARAFANRKYYQEIAGHLDQEGVDDIERLLGSVQHNKKFWSTLKLESKRPSPGNIKHYLAHLEWLKSLQFLVPSHIELPHTKYEQFINEAMAMDQSKIVRLAQDKRLALLVLLIKHQYASTLDDSAKIITKTLKKIDNLAQQKLQNYLLDHTKQTEKLVSILLEIIKAYSKNSKSKHILDKIIGTDKDELRQICINYLTYSNKHYLPFMIPLYQKQRATLFRAMGVLSFESTTKDRDVLRALTFIKQHKKTRTEWIPIIDDTGKSLTPINWIRERWWKSVTGKKSRKSKVHEVNREYFELCVFERIAEELGNGDLFIPEAGEYNDYRKNYITWEEYDRDQPGYCEESGLPDNGADFIENLQRRHTEACIQCDESLANNDFARIDKGKLILTPPRAPDKSKEAIKLSKEIQKRFPKATLLDIIIDAEKWLNLSRHFPPLSGNESRMDDPMMRFVLTVFCYGTNIGPVETARSVKGVSRKQAAWLNSQRVTEKRLDKAIVSVVNAYKKFGVIKHWGDGKSASADGKLWNAYLDNLLSEFHVRHGAYGGVAYYHVSDTYIALFSHFIPCGVYEAIYILDGLLNDESDFNPDTLHGDTQAQSTPVFGLAYLLGIKLMPRIRNIKDLTFYKPSKTTKFNNIGALFKESINWNLIEEYYDDMMLIAMSIRAGKMTASTVLRRFGTKNRKNKVYFAFRELGRVVRTIFLMEYIADQDMRKMVNAATCKSEEFNEFASWIFFANGGKIAANCRAEQTKIVKYNHLLANIAALHNVNSMTKIFNDLRAEGYPLTVELIAGLSPYHTEHYGRLGSFDLKLSRKVKPLYFGLKDD